MAKIPVVVFKWVGRGPVHYEIFFISQPVTSGPDDNCCLAWSTENDMGDCVRHIPSMLANKRFTVCGVEESSAALLTLGKGKLQDYRILVRPDWCYYAKIRARTSYTKNGHWFWSKLNKRTNRGQNLAGQF